MGLLRKILFFIIALPLAVLTIYFLVQVWPERCDTPITCESDTTCGGAVELTRVCQDGAVFAQGQRNTCVNAGTCEASCETSFEPWLIEQCSAGCESGACL